jgi:drug/metabolite transporter (DMT)-like permease
MKKKHAFIVGIISLLGIYFITLAAAPETIPAIGPAAIAGIVGACGFSLGSNVADNWQRSKYYRTELDQKSIQA